MSFFNKLASVIEMSFNITDSEKKIAAEVSEDFEEIKALLEQTEQHITNVLLQPLEKAPQLSTKIIDKYKGIFNRIRGKVEENYQDIKKKAFLASNKLQNFATDTDLKEILDAFENSMEEFEQNIDLLLQNLQDYDSSEYKDNLINKIIDLQKNIKELIEIIEERILIFLKENILGTTWSSDVAKELSNQLQESVPLLDKLYHERQQMLKGSV